FGPFVLTYNPTLLVEIDLEAVRVVEPHLFHRTGRRPVTFLGHEARLLGVAAVVAGRPAEQPLDLGLRHPGPDVWEVLHAEALARWRHDHPAAHPDGAREGERPGRPAHRPTPHGPPRRT